MAWYGESYRLDWGHAIGGTAWTAIDQWQDHFDDTSHTVTAGDDVIVGSYADPADWTAFADYADPITVRWALEVVGGSGDLHLSSGVDPTWSYSDPSFATQDLGTISVTGAGTFVSAPVSIDHATLVAQSVAPIVRIQCVSGSFEVAQVKLRVWPAAGAGGAWVPAGEGVAQNNVARRRALMRAPGTLASELFTTQIDEYLSYPEPDGAKRVVDDAQPGAIAQLADAVGATSDFVVTEGVGPGQLADARAIGHASVVNPTETTDIYYTGEASVNTRAGYVWADYAGVLPDVEMPGADPAEHRYEDEAYVRPVGGGRLVRSFGGWTTATVRASYGRPLDPLAVNGWATGPAVVHQVTVGALPPETVPFQIVAGGVETVIPAGVEGVDASVTVDIPLTGGELLLIGADVPGLFAPTAPVAGMTDSDFFGIPAHAYDYSVQVIVDLISAGHRVTFGPVEVFDPAAVAQSPRFFVKDLDGVMRPVGFGKPATETAVFRVPTAVGMYRDLTTTEYATYGPDSRPPGGYPLKVKRLDAGGQVWWDHVGWMIPD